MNFLVLKSITSQKILLKLLHIAPCGGGVHCILDFKRIHASQGRANDREGGGGQMSVHIIQGVTKSCRQSLLTNSALATSPTKFRTKGEVAGSQFAAKKYSCSHYMTWSPNKFWRSTSIFNLWHNISDGNPSSIQSKMHQMLMEQISLGLKQIHG